MITVYHLATSRSERIVWLLGELGLPYEIQRFDRRPDRFARSADARGRGPSRHGPRAADDARPARLVEDAVGRSPFIAGERFTGADIMMPFWFTTALRFRILDLAPYPGIRAYTGRVGEHPAYRRAMDRAGPGVTG